MVAALRASAAAISADRFASASCSTLYRAASAGLRTSVSSLRSVSAACRTATFSCSVRIAWSRSAWASGPAAAAWADGRVGLGLDLGLLQRQVRWAIAISCSAAIRACSAACRALASAIGRGLADPRGLGPAEVGEVVAVVGDVLDLEGVEDQALAGQRGLGLVGHPLGERRPVADDLLDRQAADDRAQGAGEHLLGEGLDLRPAG